MEWKFSIAWFFIGILVIIAGILTVIYYSKIADLMLGGVKDYQKTKLGGLIMIGVGVVFMTNTHLMLLTAIVRLFFKN